MKVLAIGDIHTKSWIIDKVECRIKDYDIVIFVGDYADDWKAGPVDTLRTWDSLKALQARHPEKVRMVLGNHDYIYINKTPSTASGYNKITQTLINAPENGELRHWLSQMPYLLLEDGVTYSHAGVTLGWDYGTSVSQMWNNYSPIWARPDDSVYADIPQVFGHTPNSTCLEVQPNIWCIDTFSTYPEGDSIGDHTVLEIIDGIEFNVVEL